jgi:hypothetical protein
VWVKDPQEGTFLVHGSESTMREIFGNVIEKMPVKLVDLSVPEAMLSKVSKLPLASKWLADR